MTQNESTDTTTDVPSGEYLRNDPAPSFEAHLFDADDVADAGGGVAEESERPVSSICSRSTSYGEFRAVEGDDGDLCDVCRSTVEGDDEVNA